MAKVVDIFGLLKKQDRRGYILNGLIVACTIVTGFAMFTGFVALGENAGIIEIAAAALFTILIASALTYSIYNAMAAETLRERIVWCLSWLACAIISVVMGYGMYFSLLSARTHAQDQVRAEVTNVVAPLMTFGAAYGQMSSAATEAARYSGQVAALEHSQGGTCPGSTRPEDGPRTRLRNADAALFQSFATHFSARAKAVNGAIAQADAASRTYTPAAHAAAMTSIREAHSVALLAATDPRIKDWAKTLDSRIAAGRGPMTDPASGAVFTCPDGALEGKLAGAARVALPKLPAGIADIEAPSHSSGVRRGLQIAMLNTPFEARIDALPFLMGAAVDILLVVFVRAKSRLDSPTGGSPRPSNSTPGSVVVGMRSSLGRRSTIGALGHRLTAALDGEPWGWLELVQRWSWRNGYWLRIAVPCDSSAHPDAHRLRMIVAFIAASSSDMKYRMTRRVSALHGPLGEMCRERLAGNVLVDVYRAPPDVVRQLEQDWLLWSLSGDAGNEPIAPRAA